MITIRPAAWPADEARLAALDTRFTTDRRYRPVLEELAFWLVEETLDHPVEKRYPLDPTDRGLWHFAAVAEQDSEVVGFAAAEFAAWNRRVVLWHLYVAPNCRGIGVGSDLLTAVADFAHSKWARCVWVETQDVNYPAVQFYRKHGFQFVGFDASLYDAAAMEHPEIALFFAYPLDAEGV